MTIEPVFLAGSADDQRVALVWDAGAMRPSAWIILRDGLELARLDADVRSLDDTTAPAGSIGPFTVSASLGLATGIEVNWSTPSSAPGTQRRYEAVAELPDASVFSNEVMLGRAPPSLVAWEVSARDASVTLPASQSYWLDTDAPPPGVTVTGLASRSIADDFSSSVAVVADASVSLSPVNIAYVVRAVPSAGAAREEGVLSSRGTRVEFQWQRSTTDSPTAFVDLPVVHGREWADFEAVFSEGRYYRVAVRWTGGEALSTPTRTVLLRPVAFLTHPVGAPWMVREDGLALPLGRNGAAVQFPEAREFFADRDRPCAVLRDGGVVCAQGTSLVSLPLPPTTHVVSGTNGLCAQVDGGAACLDTNGLSIVTGDTSELLDLTMVGASLVCGHLVDAGQRCVSASAPPIDLGAVLAAWFDQTGRLHSSFDDGTISPPPVRAPLPVEDAGYVADVFHGLCAIRADGYVRCARYAASYEDTFPPISRERVRAAQAFPGSTFESCLQTESGRIRCRGPFARRWSPPLGPMRTMAAIRGTNTFLGEDGRIEPCCYGSPPDSAEIAFGDRFSAITTTSTNGAQLVLQRTDGTLNARFPVPDAAFAAIAGDFALYPDGGLADLQNSGAFTGQAPADGLLMATQGLVCARRGGQWECPGRGVFPGAWVAIGADLAGTTCGLTARGEVICQPALSQPWASRRYASLRGETNGITLITTEGEMLRLSGGTVVQVGLPWDDWIEGASESSCGIRRDRTAACVGPEFPWTGQ